jgi:hypothetical protein
MPEPSTRARVFLLLVGFAVVAATTAGAVGRQPATRILGDTTSDAAGIERGLWVVREQHVNPFTQTRDEFAGAPEGIPVSPAVNAVQPVQPAALWGLRAVVGRVGAINVFLLVCLLTTAVGGYLFARRILGVGDVAATTAAFALTFNPWVIAQSLAGHLDFVMLWPLLAVVAALARLDERRDSVAAGALGVTVGVSFLVAAYMGLLASLIATVGVVVVAVREGSRRDRLAVVSVSLGAVAVVAAVLAPGLVAYALNRDATAITVGHAARGASTLGVWPQQYLNPGPFLAALGDLHVGTRSVAFGAVETTVYFGFSTLALAALATYLLARNRLHTTRRTRGVLTICAAMVPVAVIFSMPTALHVGGANIPLPSTIIAHATSYYRIYSRFAMVAGVGLVLLAAAAIDAVARRRRVAGVALAALVVVELWPATLPSWSTSARPIDRWLAQQPSGIVATYPQPTDSEFATRLALADLAYQPRNGQRLYTLIASGTHGTREAAIRILTRYLNDRSTASLLAAEHVRYLVVRDDVYSGEGVTPPIPEPADAFRLLARIGPSRVYALDASRVARVDIPRLLSKRAAEIALAQGLTAPRVRFDSGFETHAGKPVVFGQAELELDGGPRSPSRVEIYMTAAAYGAAETTVAVSEDTGREVARQTVGSRPTKFSFGPVTLRGGRARLIVNSSPGYPARIVRLLVLPLANVSTSLRSTR